jgi:hypothetical protein
MSVNDPYSKTEVDLKLEAVEERIDHKFTILLGEFEKMHVDIVGFKEQITQQISDLRGLITATGIGLLLTLVGVILPIAFTLWQNAFHLPR